MRIAFVKQKYVASGGGERYLDRLVAACTERGHEVHLITTSWPSRGATGPRIHRVSFRKHSRAARLRSFAAAAAACAENEAFDVIFSLDRTGHQDIWRAGEGVHRVWLDRRREIESGLKVALAEHTPGHRALLELEARCVRNSSHIIANSHMVKDDIRRVYGDAAAEVTVVYNGVDPLKFRPAAGEQEREAIRESLPIRDHQKMLLFVGSGFRRKGLAETLQALSRVESGFLVAVGRDAPTSWQRLARRLGVSDRVAFLGPRPDLVPFYHAADVGVLPSWFDPFPNVGLEALFCGTPLITSRYAGVHELIASPDTGSVLSRPSAIEEYVGALEEQLSRGASAERRAGIAESVAAYTMDANVESTLQVIAAASEK